MMSRRVLEFVMITLVAPVPSFASVMISPSIAAECHNKSNPNDACQYDFPCHLNLLCSGLKPKHWALFNPYDGDAA
jgi:hypothetical protein